MLRLPVVRDFICRRSVAFSFGVCAALFLPGAPAPADEFARLKVTDRVIAPDPGPFTFTFSMYYPIGNGATILRQGSGFEPIIYRDWIQATEDAPDRIIAAPQDISRWNSLASGALDGGEVEILRIEDGAFRVVRRTNIPKGGFQAGGWRPGFPGGRAIAPSARSHVFAWDAWNRPNAPSYLRLRAVDRAGRPGRASAIAVVTSPAKIPPADQDRFKALVQVPWQGLAEAQSEGSDPSRNLAAPKSFAAREGRGGEVVLSWKAEDDPRRAGWILEISDTLPSTHKGHYIALTAPEGEDAPPVRRGDLVRISKRITRPGLDFFNNRIWGAGQETRVLRQGLTPGFADQDPTRRWHLAEHAPDTPVTEPGETYLEMELTGEGPQVVVQAATDSGTAQNWYPVLEPGKPYRVSFWAKAEAKATTETETDQAVEMRFMLHGFHSEAAHKVAPITFQAGPDWQYYEGAFTPRVRNPGARPGFMRLVANGPATVSLDNFRVHRADLPYLELMPEDIARLEASGMRAMRSMTTATTKRRTYDLAQLTHPAGLASGIRMQASLPVNLAHARSAGMEPWLNIEPHLSHAEWLGLVEYLAAPADPAHPWAMKRASQGQEQPWVAEFDRIYFELGNETWNRIFAPWTFPEMRDGETGERLSRGTVYGLYQEYVMGILRQSPWWDQTLEDKILVVLGGQEVYPGYGADAAHRAPSAELLTTGAYINGWETTDRLPKTTPKGFSRLLTHVLQSAMPYAEQHRSAIEGAPRRDDRPLMLGTYEAGPGYQLNGLNGARVGPEDAAEQERVMKSLASGVATLDAFLARAAQGYQIQNFYGYGPGEYWRSHALDKNGGQAYPSWRLLEIYNRRLTGDFLEVETLEVPRITMEGEKHRLAVDDGPLIGAYATRTQDRLALVVISRRVPDYPEPGDDGMTRVEIELPEISAESLTEISMTGDYDSTNITLEEVRPFEMSLPIPGDRLVIPDLAPGSVRIYLFEGLG